MVNADARSTQDLSINQSFVKGHLVVHWQSVVSSGGNQQVYTHAERTVPVQSEHGQDSAGEVRFQFGKLSKPLIKSLQGATFCKSWTRRHKLADPG